MQLKKRAQFFVHTLLQHKKLFFAGIVVKLVLGSFLASDYLVNLFVPFLKYATTQNFTGAYDYFHTNGNSTAFPYPVVMLVILSIPKFLLSFLSSGNLNTVGFVDIFSVRLALLLADTVILFVLLQWLKKYTKQVYWFYWLSPMLLYINYIHGQLDVLPVAFLFVSLYYLFKNKFWSCCILLAFAIACKTSIFLAVPFVFIYGFKNQKHQPLIFWKGVLLFTGITILLNIPYFYSAGFVQMVYHNAEQVKLFSTSLLVSEHFEFLVVPAVYLLLVMRFTGYWQMSRNLLLMYLGFAFGLITIFIAANQGWYYWCMPFFIYFLIKEFRYSLLPFILVNVFYFLYFGIVKNSDYLQVWQLVDKDWASGKNLFTFLQDKGLPMEQYTNIVSTLLQASLIGFCYFIYRYGISQIQFNKMLYQPYLIGIAGDSATGKSTLANALQYLFGKQNATVINGDDMHKWERGDKNWESMTHLNPKANTLHLNMLHTLQFLKGHTINRQQYSHETGAFQIAQKIPINRIALFEGLHSFFLEYQKQLFDLKIYMKPDEELRISWKMNRDVNERGYDQAKVLDHIAARKNDAASFVEQQEKDADIIIAYQDKNETGMQLQFQCLNHFYLDTVIHDLQKEGVEVVHEYAGQWQFVLVNGSIKAATINSIAENYNDELEALGFGQVQWMDNFNGITQLLIVQIIFYKMQLMAATNSEGIV